MESRAKWFRAAVQCMGGTTVLCVIILIALSVTADGYGLRAQEIRHFWTMPVPCLALLPLMALLGKGVLGCGYAEAFKQTAKAYGYGALLGIACIALTVVLYDAAEYLGDWYRYVTCC